MKGESRRKVVIAIMDEGMFHNFSMESHEPYDINHLVHLTF